MLDDRKPGTACDRSQAVPESAYGVACVTGSRLPVWVGYRYKFGLVGWKVAGVLTVTAGYADVVGVEYAGRTSVEKLPMVTLSCRYLIGHP